MFSVIREDNLEGFLKNIYKYSIVLLKEQVKEQSKKMLSIHCFQ